MGRLLKFQGKRQKVYSRVMGEPDPLGDTRHSVQSAVLMFKPRMNSKIGGQMGKRLEEIFYNASFSYLKHWTLINKH